MLNFLSGKTVGLILRITLMLGLIAWVATGLLRKEMGLRSYEEIYTARYLQARSASNVDIAVVYAEGEEELYFGVDLAFANRSVTVKNKKLGVRLHPFKTGNNSIEVKDQIAMARKIARDDNYVAVIGHSTSDVASMASVSYEYTKLLYMASTATDPALTTHGFAYTFRTIASDEQYAGAVALLCSRLKVSRVGIFYEQSPHSVSAIDDLQGALDNRSISTVFEKSYEALLGVPAGGAFEQRQRQARLQDQIASVEHLAGNERPEMIAIIGDGVLSAVQLWKGLSVSGLRDLPIVLFGGPLDANAFTDQTQRQRINNRSSTPILLDINNEKDMIREPRAIYIASQFSPAEVNEVFTGTDEAQRNLELQRITELKQFIASYMSRFKDQPAELQRPEALAFRGYAAGSILRLALGQSESIAPVDVQETLKSNQKKFEALGRLFSFNTQGDETVERLGAPGMPILFKKFSPATTQ